MKRRELLGALGVLPLGAVGCSRQEQKPVAARRGPEQNHSSNKLPVVFAAHGAPLLVAAGAVVEERPRVEFPIVGWWNDSAFTKRSVRFG